MPGESHAISFNLHNLHNLHKKIPQLLNVSIVEIS